LASKYFHGTPLDSSLLSAFSGGIMIYIATVSIIILRNKKDFVFSDVLEVWMGLIWGIVIVMLAILLFFDRKHHTQYGIAIMVFSIASIYGTDGGELVGLVLGFIAGIMAIEYKPSGMKRPEVSDVRIK